MTTKEKLQKLAEKITEQNQAELVRAHLNCEANMQNAVASVKMGRKYANVDIGYSGRYMVELESGRIFGIKGYGQIHRGHYFGTLDTIDDYYWGFYYAGQLQAAQS